MLIKYKHSGFLPFYYTTAKANKCQCIRWESGNKYSRREAETACSDWSLLLWPDTLDFCVASVGSCQRAMRKEL